MITGSRSARSVLFLLIVLSSKLNLFAQANCAGIVIPAAGNCASGTALSNGANMNSGTYFYCNTDNPTYNINLSGATLQVCGNLTIGGGSNFNSGTIIVSRQGSLTFAGNVILNSNFKIVNYGKIQFNGDLEFQNQNNYLMNADTDAVITLNNDMTFAQNSNQSGYFYNKGKVSSGGSVIIRNGANICLEGGSVFKATSFTYNANNNDNLVAFTGTSNNTATLAYTSNFTITNNRILTASNKINICAATGANAISGNGSKGSATTSTGCNVQAATFVSAQGASGGCMVLPIELLAFTGAAGNGAVELNWQTASERNNKKFVISRSYDALQWEYIGSVPGAGDSYVPRSYTYTDAFAHTGMVYYRLSQVDADGSIMLSGKVIAINNEALAQEESYVFPNPAKESFTVTFPLNTSIVLHIFDASGNVVHTNNVQLSENNGQFQFNNILQPGVYVIRIASEKHTYTHKLVVQY